MNVEQKEADKLLQVSQHTPDGNHPHHRQDAGQHEDEAGETVQGPLVDLGEGRDVGQASKLQRQLQDSERRAWRRETRSATLLHTHLPQRVCVCECACTAASQQ